MVEHEADRLPGVGGLGPAGRGAQGRGVHDGHRRRHVHPPRVGGLQPCPVGQRRGRSEQAHGQLQDAARPEDGAHGVRVQHGFGGHIEGPARAVGDHAPVRVRHVLGRERLESQAPREREHRSAQAGDQPGGDEVAQEVVLDLGPGGGLEDQPGAQPGHEQLGVLGLHAVEDRLDLGLLRGVVRGGDPGGGMGLGHGAALRPGPVRAHRGRVDQVGHARLGHGPEHPLVAGHVDGAQVVAVAVGADHPHQVDDGVGAGHDLAQPPRRRGLRHVQAVPLDAVVGRSGPVRAAPAHAHDRAHLVRGLEAVQDSGAHVAGGAQDDDPHGFRTTLTQPSSFFWNVS